MWAPCALTLKKATNFYAPVKVNLTHPPPPTLGYRWGLVRNSKLNLTNATVKPLKNLLHIAPVRRTFSEILCYYIWTMIYTVASIPRYQDTAQYNLYSAGENCESWAELLKCTTDNLFSSHVFLLNLLLKYKFTLQDQQFQILRFSSVAMWWDGWRELWTVPYCVVL